MSGERSAEAAKEGVATEPYEVEEVFNKKLDTDPNYRHEYLWRRVLIHVLLQLAWLIGIYTLFFTKWQTILFAYVYGFCSSQAIALGAHRCYSHKSFKPSLPLHAFFMYFHTVAGQNSLYTWVRDHKLHHKYSDTDADPHNASRGFFFSHMGWLMVRRHPLVLEKQRQVDMSDMRSDKLVMFQYNYFLQIYFFVAFLIPVAVPMYFWAETAWNSFFVAYCFRYVTVLHITWCINSAAHIWGTRPYDRRIKAVQSLFAWLVTGGEGWHNYHHAFPWDCRLSEYGQFGGVSTTVLDALAYLGLASDLKVAPLGVVYGHMRRHGDGSARKILRELDEKFGKIVE